MISTVTTTVVTVVTTVASIKLVASLVLVAQLTLVLSLVARELANVGSGPSYKLLGSNLRIPLVALVVAFAFVAILRVAQVLVGAS